MSLRIHNNNKIQHPELVNTIRRVNNIHRDSISQHIQELESQILASSVNLPQLHNPADIFTWLSLLITTLIQAQNCGTNHRFYKLGLDEYMYILECCKIVSGLDNQPVNNRAVCLYIVNSLLPRINQLLDSKQFMDLEEYISGQLDENNVIQAMLAFYTNIRKLEFLTNTGYTGQFKSIYTCLYKFQIEAGTILLDELPSYKLVSGVESSSNQFPENNINIAEFNKMFRQLDRKACSVPSQELDNLHENNNADENNDVYNTGVSNMDELERDGSRWAYDD